MDEGHCGLPADELAALAGKAARGAGALIETALALELEAGDGGGRHGGGPPLRVPGRALPGRAGHRRAAARPRRRAPALAGDRRRQGDPLGRAQDRPGAWPTARRQALRLALRSQGAGDHRRPRRRQDHAGQLHPADASGPRASRSRSARRPGGRPSGWPRAPGWRPRPSTGCSRPTRRPAASSAARSTRSTATCWWWTRPAWSTCR